MVLSRLTKITGPGVSTDTNWVGNNADFTGITTSGTSFNIGVTTIHSNLIEAHNIKSTGVVTAISFSGDGSGLTGVANTDFVVGTAITMGTANFTGNVTIGGTLTYEDVTNIDSVGLITARDGIVVTDATESNSPTTGSVKLSGGLGVVKNIYTSGGAYVQGSAGLNVSHSTDINGDLDVDGHTNLDNISIAGVTTVANDTEFIFGTNSTNTDRPLKIKYRNSSTRNQFTGKYIDFNVSDARFVNISNNAQIAQFYHTSVNLFYNGTQRFSTAPAGATVYGNLQIQANQANLLFVDENADNDFSIKCDGGSLQFVDSTDSYTTRMSINSSGNVSIVKDLDVDGHTNLDNVSIAGVVTATTIKGNGDGMSGIHTVATDPSVTPSNSLLSIGNAGSYRFIQSHGGQQLRINSVGNQVILPHNRTFLGTNFVTSITNNADNRVITGGTNGDIIGESNLTYNGNILTLNNDADQEGILMTGGDVYHTLTFNANRNIQNYSLGDVRGKWNGTEVNRIRFNTGADTTNRDEGWITFWTKPSGGGIAERLRIGSDGQINIAGILTATTVTQRTSKFYGLTTTDRNALSPSEGDIIYNTTTNKHEFYTASSVWAPISAQAPEFDNASGSLATFYSESRSYVTPTSPTASGDAPLAYSISAGSLPSGMSINSSTGILSGTPNAVGSDTTSNFTVRVSNTGGAVERDYSITVKAPVTTNYSYTGSTVNWSKPDANVKRVLFRMWGGAGSHGTCSSNAHYPGAGGKTEGVINVTSHNNLYLQVGEAGGNANSGPNGGWPNGGNGNISHSCKGAGGGGSSNIYHSSGTGSYTYIVAVAGGGGSVSHGNPNSNGGDGGGTNGGSSNRGGGGGTQNAGGSQGTTACGNTGNSGTGTRLQGGTAGTGSGCINAGAGGGGGWWGGGAGGNSNSGNTYGGGGGGSGYFDTSLVSSGATKTYGDSGWSDNKPSGIAQRAGFGDNNRGGMGYITLIY